MVSEGTVKSTSNIALAALFYKFYKSSMTEVINKLVRDVSSQPI